MKVHSPFTQIAKDFLAERCRARPFPVTNERHPDILVAVAMGKAPRVQALADTDESCPNANIQL